MFSAYMKGLLLCTIVIADKVNFNQKPGNVEVPLLLLLL